MFGQKSDADKFRDREMFRQMGIEFVRVQHAESRVLTAYRFMKENPKLEIKSFLARMSGNNEFTTPMQGYCIFDITFWAWCAAESSKTYWWDSPDMRNAWFTARVPEVQKYISGMSPDWGDEQLGGYLEANQLAGYALMSVQRISDERNVSVERLVRGARDILKSSYRKVKASGDDRVKACEIYIKYGEPELVQMYKYLKNQLLQRRKWGVL